jgi:hypothetical protein
MMELGIAVARINRCPLDRPGGIKRKTRHLILIEHWRSDSANTTYLRPSKASPEFRLHNRLPAMS